MRSPNRAALAAMMAAGCFFFSATACSKSKDTGLPVGNIQPPVVAGSFYPSDPAVLKKMTEGFINATPKKDIGGKIIGLIAPHAGYQYSGPVAGAAFREIAGSNFSRVVVIAPSHHMALKGAALSSRGTYRTPLGDIPIDREAVDSLAARYSWAKIDDRPYEVEHSLEVELPFLQIALKDFKLVPLIVGAQDMPTMDAIAADLASLFSPGDTLFVASSDLSHFKTYSEAKKTDEGTIASICGSNAKSYYENVLRGTAELCGSSPVYIMKKIAELRGASLKPIEYANSGDTAGDKSRVVGYAAIAVVAKEEPTALSNKSFYTTLPSSRDPQRTPEHASGLVRRAPCLKEFLGQCDQELNGHSANTAQKQELVKFARATVEAFVSGRKLPPIPDDPYLKKPGAAFVTLKKNGNLRGCIGQIIAQGPLGKTVQEMAVAAASQDPRFPPVRAEELKDIKLEISVLTPPEILPNPQDVRVGIDGLIIEKGFNRGVLLPQVPGEMGWDKERYLVGICEKAGMAPNCWHDAKLRRFQAIVFGE